MKKGIIVLLIMALVAGYAFAGFSGSASVSYGVGLDENANYGFTNKQETKFEFEFALESAEAEKSEHSTNVWAEIAASAEAKMTEKGLKVEAEISKANIHVYDVTINILGPKAAYDYAASFTKDADKNPIFDYSNNAKFDYDFGGVELQYEGFSVSVAQSYKYAKEAAGTDASFSSLVWISDAKWATMSTADQAKYEATTAVTTDPAGKYYATKVKAKSATPASENNTIFVGAETKSFEVAEGVTVQGAVNFMAANDGSETATLFGGAVKAAYKTDDIKASIAADVDYADKTIAADVLVNAGYKKLAVVDVYYGVEKAQNTDAEMALEAKVTSEIPAGDYKVTVKAEADRLLNVKNTTAKHFNGAWAGYTASAETTIDAITAKVYGNYNQVVDTAVVAGKTVDVYGMNAGAEVTYKADMFTCKAGAAVLFFDNAQNAITASAIKPTASIESAKVVENATLTLAWSGARFALADGQAKTNGTISATAKIAF